ncbi:MAG: TonB-dependent receptor [Prevotella sp.]|nr:TonB-dependent receptor [Prevotella sp.]
MSIQAQTVTPHLYVEQDSCVEINEVVVTGLTGTTKMKYSPTPISVVNHNDLHQQFSTNIIDAISRQPGVSQVTTGSGISKPVIRGLGYNRVVVVNDGIRQEGQQWGDEHGIEIDAETVNSVEILKGPASLRYGSDAMAGVIIFHDAPQLTNNGIRTTVSSEYQTNNGLFDYSLAMQGRQEKLFWGARWSQKTAHAYKNRYDGYVYGSQFSEQALTGNVGLHHALGQSQLKLSYYHLLPSIVEGERDEDTGAFEVADGYESLKSYHHALPYQQINHYKAVFDNTLALGEGSLKAILAYQQNRRQEYEEPKEAELDFLLHTINYDIHYHVPLSYELQLVVGAGGMYQHSSNKGEEYLIPDYRLFDAGLFTTLSYNHRDWTFSGGLRADYRHINASELYEDDDLRFHHFSRNITGYTGSAGAIYNLTPRLNLRANLSRGFRAPNISELASNGEHEGTARYEIGNDRLKPEYSTQIDLGVDYSSYLVSVQVALFANQIDHFIFARHDPSSPAFTGYRTYVYTQGDARLYGGEATIDMHPMKNLHFINAFSMVNARLLHQTEDAKWLPLTPAPRWNMDVRYEWPALHLKANSLRLTNAYVAGGLECNLRQNHFYAVDDTETATPSYTLLNASVGTDLTKNGRRVASVSLIGSNLTDKAYQNHLSRLKYTDLNNATRRRGIYNMGRNLTLKLTLFI